MPAWDLAQPQNKSRFHVDHIVKLNLLEVGNLEHHSDVIK